MSSQLNVKDLGGVSPQVHLLDMSDMGTNLTKFDSPLDLKAEDGFRMKYAVPKIAPEKIIDHNGMKFVEANDLIGKSGGRIEEWKLSFNISESRKRNWPGIKPAEFLSRRKTGNPNDEAMCAIVGSGPSISQHSQLRELRKLQKAGVKVHAINRCHDFLITKGIIPWSASLLDPIPHVATYIKPRAGVRYEIGSQCDGTVFDVFEKPGIDHYIWHARTIERLDNTVFSPQELSVAVPSRTSTNGMRSIMLKYMQGFRHFHLFGFDSSYEDYFDDAGELQIKLGADGKGKLHGHAKPEALHDVRKARVVEKSAAGETLYERDYYTNSAMLCQANEFSGFISDVAGGIREGFMDTIYIYVHGDGLLPDMACSRNYRLHFDRKRNRNV